VPSNSIGHLGRSNHLCRSRVAWSRLGCVAAIAPDLLSVNIRHLTFSGSERKWHLSDEHVIDLSTNGDNQHPISQLGWSQSGAELALTDAAGRVTIINSSSMALNETAVVRPAGLDRDDELNQVLAIYWFNLERQVGQQNLFKHKLSYTDQVNSTQLMCKHLKIKRSGRSWQPNEDQWDLIGYERSSWLQDEEQ
jgi:hypothetical protein